MLFLGVDTKRSEIVETHVPARGVFVLSHECEKPFDRERLEPVILLGVNPENEAGGGLTRSQRSKRSPAEHNARHDGQCLALSLLPIAANECYTTGVNGINIAYFQACFRPLPPDGCVQTILLQIGWSLYALPR